MRQLRTFILVVVVGFAVYFFFLRNRAPQVIAETTAEETTTTQLANPQTSTNSSADQSAVQANAVSSDSSTDSATSASTVKAKIQTWLLQESKNLNQPHVDAKEKDLELKRTVENYSLDEKKIILETAGDSTRTANERILASYMLGLDQSQGSEENLAELAQKAVPDFGPVQPHSEAELRHSQELAVRYMPVDELAKRASNNASALEALRKLASAAESADVRSYAQRVLKEIK